MRLSCACVSARRSWLCTAPSPGIAITHQRRGYRRQPRTAREMQWALLLDDMRGERAVGRATKAREAERLVEGEQARIQLSVAKARLASDYAQSKLRLMSDNISAGNITPGSVDLF